MTTAACPSCEIDLPSPNGRKLPLECHEPEETDSVENAWYVGWGIRWIPGQYVLWNVSGLRAVELTLKDGRRFRIGTDEPEALLHAIQAAGLTHASEHHGLS